MSSHKADASEHEAEAIELAMVINQTKQKSALLAIILASGALSSQLPARSDAGAAQTNSVIQQLANTSEANPSSRAFYLLLMARSYMTEENRKTVETQYSTIANELKRPDSFIWGRNREFILTSWSERAALEKNTEATKTQNKNESSSQFKPEERNSLANAAIERATSLIEKSSDKFVQLNLYFIALQLFERTGNLAGARECQKYLDEALEAYKSKSSTDEELIKATSSILNAKAYALIPLHIEDHAQRDSLMTQKKLEPISEDTFKKCQQLKLKAIDLVDRLDKGSHTRRKAHRDLVLWYMQLGKNGLAENEKQVLFDLVGYRDDSVLYPQSVACGHLRWWTKEKVNDHIACGMG